MNEYAKQGLVRAAFLLLTLTLCFVLARCSNAGAEFEDAPPVEVPEAQETVTEAEAEPEQAEPAEATPQEDETAQQEAETSDGMKSLGMFYITGYDICLECCGKLDGITASGAKAQVGQTVASNYFPFGTRLFIDGIGTRIVEDRGPGSMGDDVLDVLCEDHATCYAITGWHEVFILPDE